MPGRVEGIEFPDVNRWCHLHLGTQVAEELFRGGYLSTVIGLRLTSGQSIVVKVRRPAERLIACWTVQRHLFDCGFPCPEPLVGPEPLRDHVASAEALVLGGELFPTSGRAAAPFAESLALPGPRGTIESRACGRGLTTVTSTSIHSTALAGSTTPPRPPRSGSSGRHRSG